MSLQDAFRLALSHHQAGRLREAESLYRQILAVAPAHADSWHLLGVVAHQAGQQREAIRLISEAIRLAPQAADYYANLGEAWRSIGELESAIVHFETALRLNPQQLSALNNLSIALIDLHRYRAAAVACRKALAVRPDYGKAWNNLATALQHLGEYTDAIAAYEQAIATLPPMAALWCGLGTCRLKQQEAQAALAAFEQALVLDARAIVAQQGYAESLLALGRGAEVRRLLADASAELLAQHPGLAVVAAQARAAQGVKAPEEVRLAVAELRGILRRQKGFLPAHAALLPLLAHMATHPEVYPPLAEAPLPPPPEPVPFVSIIICSINPDKFAAVTARYRALFAGLPHEIIGIHDARSLCEGYNRGAGRSQGSLLVFSHDDIELLNDDFARRVIAHLAQFDLVGVAGTRRLVDPAIRRAGFPHMAGMVAHHELGGDSSDDNRYAVAVFGLEEITATGIEAVDGCWFAVRRTVWETCPFDEATFDGFHLYDIDFSFAAHLAGFRLTVAADLVLAHQSKGDFSADWERYAERFRQKYAAQLEERQTLRGQVDFLPGVGLSSPEAVLRFAALCRACLPTGYYQQSTEDYALWLTRYGQVSEAERARQQGASAEMALQPLFSILLPTYNPPERWLRRALDTVLAQTWSRWELCIADDASPAPHVRRVLDEYASRDPRIRLVYRNRNGHICAASNSALALAQGDWLVLLDHDDELTPDALYWQAREINAFPEAGILYSDEDKIDEAGQRHGPYFKPDWNYDLFLSHNLVSHLGAYRTNLVRELGGFRAGLEGSQDYDLALRCVEKLSPAQIRHIPRVLYHWRTLAASTASGEGAKPYAYVAAKRAIREHLQRIGQSAEVLDSPEHPALVRVRYPLPETPPQVSLIIPTRDQLPLLQTCLASLQHTRYPNLEILVVDNGSAEPETLAFLDTLRQRPGHRVLRDERPFNFSALNNRAVAEARGELICLLNNDIEVLDPDWLAEMVGHALRPGIGAVGARLWYPDGTLQHGGVILVGGVAAHAHRKLPKGYPGFAGRALTIQNFSAVTAACLVVRKALYETVGGMDEALAVAFNDVDFCLKLGQAGYRNLWTPHAELIHHESKTRGEEDSPEKRARFAAEVALMQSRWGSLLQRDPAYSPNLCRMREDFALAWPPRHEAGDGA